MKEQPTRLREQARDDGRTREEYLAAVLDRWGVRTRFSGPSCGPAQRGFARKTIEDFVLFAVSILASPMETVARVELDPGTPTGLLIDLWGRCFGCGQPDLDH